jgi:tetratricopeptide (TPR) repeat protein
MSDARKAVFLSYASQDAETAKRIADAVRAAGVEVWFDQSELVGGDAWDAKIRGQISSCALFVPVISTNTQARREGYFRLEWKLAAQRTHMIADGTPFLFPVVIDDTRDIEALVPAEFKAVQWTKLFRGETAEKFGERVKTLLGGAKTLGEALRPDAAEELVREAPPTVKHSPRWPLPVIAGTVIALLAVVLSRPWEKFAPSSGSVNPAASLSEAQQLVAKAWVLLNKPEMAREELDAADDLCKRAAALDSTDGDVWAAWSTVNTWYVFHNLDASPSRREAAQEDASRAMQLAPQSFESRLAQALYWVRGEMDVPRERDAQRLLRELLQERPDEPRVLFTLGFLLVADKSTFGEGIDLLERLAKNPNFAAVALDEMGWAHYFYGDFAAAETAADRSLSAHPYWNNLGLKITLAERVHGDMNLASALLDQMPASALQEDFGIGFACEVYQWRREPQRTIKVLDGLSRDWIRYFFDDFPKAFLLGEARLMAKQTSAAQRDFQRALLLLEKPLTDDPNNGSLLRMKAQALRYLGEQEAAEKTYRLVKELGVEDNLSVIFESPAIAVAYLRSMTDKPYGSSLGTGRMRYTAASLRLDPYFDPLREDPAFLALVAQMEAKEKAPVISKKSP